MKMSYARQAPSMATVSLSFEMAPDGSGLTAVPTESDASYAAWSPRGDLILFTAQGTGNDELFLMAPDGGEAVQLTHNETSDSFPDW